MGYDPNAEGLLYTEGLPDATEEFTYDRVNVCVAGTPVAYATRIGRSAPHILMNWNRYSQCRMRTTWTTYEGNVIREKRDMTIGREASWDSICEYISENTPRDEKGNFIQNAFVTFYDLVDNEIPTITRVMGYNMAYSRIKGSRRYRDTTSFNPSDCRWQELDNFLAEATQQFGISSWKPSLENRRVLLINSNWRTASGLLPMRKPMHLNKPMWNNANQTFEIAPSACYPSMVRFCYFGDTRTGDIESRTFTVPNAMTGVNRDRFCNARSGLVVYLISTLPYGMGTHGAIMVKPLGIDTILLDMIDFSKYVLEVVEVSRRDRTLRIINQIDNLDVSQMSPSRNAVRLSPEHWRFSSIAEGPRLRGIRKIGTIKFRLRDRVTGIVGPLTNAGIKPISNSSVISGAYTVV